MIWARIESRGYGFRVEGRTRHSRYLLTRFRRHCKLARVLTPLPNLLNVRHTTGLGRSSKGLEDEYGGLNNLRLSDIYSGTASKQLFLGFCGVWASVYRNMNNHLLLPIQNDTALGV